MDNTTTPLGGWGGGTPINQFNVGEIVFVVVRRVSRTEIKKIKNLYGSFLDSKTWLLQALKIVGYENHKHECEVAVADWDKENIYVLNTRFLGVIKEIKSTEEEKWQEKELVVKLEYRGAEAFFLPGETREMEVVLHDSKIVPLSKISIITFDELANLV
jgi:hypothetical protein